MTAPDLLPCPFCGGEAELWNAHDSRPAWIACMGRCAVLISKEHTTDAEAIAAWNTRATPAAIREAALREAAEVCAGIRQRIANGPMPEGARFDYEQAILALITEKPHDRA